ncbi:tyrosine-type recombinase/integrase [Arthrobacter psychrolactophilus]
MVDELLLRWATYLRTERSLKESTVMNYCQLVRPFLESMEVGGGLDPSGFTGGDVYVFMGKTLPGFSPVTGNLLVSAMRSLLGYLYVTGQISHRLEGAVLGRARYRNAGLPRWLPVDEVAAMIGSCDLVTVRGRRDRAIMIAISRLGLRAGEVSKLTLDDVDWRSGTLRVVGKGGYMALMPIPIDVGQALMEYLTRAPASPPGERGLFLRLRAPIEPLTSGGITSLVRAAAMRAGYEAVGAHRLRHTVATATLNAGATLEEVSQLLRHRSLTSTTIYAKVDLAHLSLIARPWPVVNSETGTPAATRAMRPRKINPVPVLTAEQVAVLRQVARPWPSISPTSLKGGSK